MERVVSYVGKTVLAIGHLLDGDVPFFDQPRARGALNVDRLDGFARHVLEGTQVERHVWCLARTEDKKSLSQDPFFHRLSRFDRVVGICIKDRVVLMRRIEVACLDPGIVEIVIANVFDGPLICVIKN